MCLNCGCGQFSNQHGDPLNITRSRLALIAAHNNSTMKEQAVNILATLLGYITEKEPREKDQIIVKITRIKAKPEMKVQYVKRTRERVPKAKNE